MITLTINAETPEEFRSILAGLLASAAAPALVAAAAPTTRAPTAAAPVAAVEQSDDAVEASPVASDGVEVVDAHGHPWNAEIHAGTKTQTKEGLWRLKVGATRPDPMPGFPVADASVAAANGAGSSASAEAAGSATATAAEAASPVDEDDEFAAFAAADAASGGAPVARTWTDADLSKLCNQAAQKLGTPEPVKGIIAKHVPEGTVPHSRNIPEANREAFAAEVETTAGITFAAG